MLADVIAQMIEDMLNEGNGTLELQRNEMANRIGCVPSQISYVISSRFTPERGYIIESRRGGGGCIRIVRKQLGKSEYLMHFFCAIGNEITESEANAYLCNLADTGLLSDQGFRIARASLSNAAFSSVHPTVRNTARADGLKQIILALMAV